jgi:LacI family transcriptional regulator
MSSHQSRSGGSRQGWPTMAEVARYARVSQKTVSRVVNREPGVLAGTEKRVLEAIGRLGYRPNDPARVLRRGLSTATVGLVVEDISDPFFSTLAKAVGEVAHRREHLVLVANSEESPALEEELVAVFAERRVAGLIMSPISSDHGFVREALATGTPIVFVDRPPKGIEADTVLSDNFGGAHQLIEHLIANGHSTIGFVGNISRVNSYSTEERLRGYHHALEAHGIRVEPNLIRSETHGVDEARTASSALLTSTNPPTALFGANSRMTIGILAASREVRRPVAVVGFDDFELADMVHPPVTVVAQDPYGLGRAAADLLFARLDGNESPAQRVTLPTAFIDRTQGVIP